jgi:hypothetical protein
MLGFLHQESPDFIALYATARKLAHSLIHNLRTPLTSGNQKAHDCVAIQARHTFRRANGATLYQRFDCLNRGIGIRGHCVPRQFFVGFAKGGFAGSATPSLDATFTEVSELLAGMMLASYACHGLFSACVEREKPYNSFGSGVRLTPRSGLAPTPVSAEAGALNQLFMVWWGHFLHLLSCRPACSERVGRFAFVAAKSSPIQGVTGSLLEPISKSIIRLKVPVKNYAFVLHGLAFNASILTLAKPIKYGHNRSQGLRIFFKIKTGLLKLLTNFGAFHSVIVLFQQFLNCVTEGRSATFRISNFGKNLLLVSVVGHKSHKAPQKDSQLGNSLVGVFTLGNAIF